MRGGCRGRRDRRRLRGRDGRGADRARRRRCALSRVLYLDCIGGAAGDMLVGALLDAGAGLEPLREGLGQLAIDGLELDSRPALRHGIGATQLIVSAPGSQPRRGWTELSALIDAAGFPARVRDRSLEAFRRLAQAEARVHRIEPEQVHFHEVGAADALADVCGFALALESLDVDRVVCSPLPLARGCIGADHGSLPLPAPAALELLRGAPIEGVDGDEELVTPTGAALIAAVATSFGELPAMRTESIGYGAGARDSERRPNLVRVLVGESLEAASEPPAPIDVRLLEANLDDLTPELVPDATAAMAAAGALDVWVTPAQMKKGRPGFVVSALAHPPAEHAVAEAMLRATTTLGVRVTSTRRYELERRWRTVEVRGEPVRVKVGSLAGEPVGAAPEHDDCAAAAARLGAPVRAVWAAALAAATTGGSRVDDGGART